MATRSSELLKKRDTEIYNQYVQMYFQEMMREEAIFEKLVSIFYLERDTIYRIVLKMSKVAASET